MKKILCMVLACALLFGLSACKPPLETGEIDPNKTQIYVAIGDNGVGTEFLYNLKAAYEAENPEYEVIIRQKDAELSNGVDYMRSATEDIIYVNGSNDFSKYTKYILDLTDMVESKSYDENGEYVGKGKGTVSLEDKMKTNENSYKMFNVGTTEDPQFLSLPWFSAVYGLWYDIDLFEDEHFYNLPGYKGIDGIANSGDEGYGPDNTPGTYDDGLPATWEDMKILLDEMKTRGMKPFTFAGGISWMRNWYLDVVLMNYEGLNDYALNYSFDGVDSDFGTIDETNGYLLKQQEGKKAMLLVAEEIAKNELYSNGSMKTTQTHMQAQSEFLDSVTEEPRSAFLIDGSWWEYEARDTFERLEKVSKDFARGTWRFGYFPVPRFIGTEGLKDQENTTQYVRDISGYLILANANTKHKDIVEDFLLFAHSESSLIEFTRTTNLFCPYDYDMGEYLDELTPLAQSVYQLLRTEGVETYYSGFETLTVSDGMTAQESLLSLRAKNNTFFDNWEYLTVVGDNSYNDPIRDMVFSSSLTASTWFEGYAQACSQAKWEDYFN